MEMGPIFCEFCGAIKEVLTYPYSVKNNILKPCNCMAAIARRNAEDRVEEELKEKAKAWEKCQRTKQLFGEIPEHFQDRSFDTFVANGDNMMAYNLAKAFPYGEGKNGLLMVGKVGRGKTHLAAAMAIEQIKLQKSVVFGTVPTILIRIRQSFSGEGPNEFQVMNTIAGCSLLVLDDLGKEKHSDWAEEKLYEIINVRYLRNLPVVITTNVGLKGIEARYPWNGEAIVSRLFEMCRGVEVAGEDYRRRI